MDGLDLDPQAAGERVEALLAELRTRAGQETADTAEELVGCLVRLYGAGLASIMRAIGDDSKLKARLIADPLVDSLPAVGPQDSELPPESWANHLSAVITSA